MYMVVLGLSETMARLLTNDFGLGNERSEAQGALRLEFNVSRFFGSLLCVFYFYVWHLYIALFFYETSRPAFETF